MMVPKPSHPRRAPKQGTRGNFKNDVRKQIYIRDQGKCRQCGKPGEEIHHIRFRSHMGRGVYTNGLTVCHSCHAKIHNNHDLAEYWMGWAIDNYGPDYYRDRWDL